MKWYLETTIWTLEAFVTAELVIISRTFEYMKLENTSLQIKYIMSFSKYFQLEFRRYFTCYY